MQPCEVLHALARRPLVAGALFVIIVSNAEGRHVRALLAMPQKSVFQKHVANPFIPWWWEPLWGPLHAKPRGESSDDKFNTTRMVRETMEETIEEVEEEVEHLETYEKRKWLHIFESRNFFDWTVFAIFATFFLFVYHRFLVGLPTRTKYHGLAIGGWVGIGLLYNAFMYMKFGREQASVWLNGYLLELIFSLENVFVFHVIVESFGTPSVLVQKALFIIVCCQVVFELVLYMGVADVIDSLGFLPYVLGAWLTYLGIHSAIESGDHSEFDILETCTVRAFRRVLGDRLQLVYDDQGLIFARVNHRYQMTLLGLVFFCLLGADFFLEIDVTLTKIEESHDEYLSFTSSALAGFAVPELFFVARDLFKRFPLLKFGISFVLIFYGTQMLFPGIIVLSPLEGCGIIVMVMVLCIVFSVLFRRPEPEGSGAFEKQHPKAMNQTDVRAATDYGSTSSTTPRFSSAMSRNTYSFVF